MDMDARPSKEILDFLEKSNLGLNVLCMTEMIIDNIYFKMILRKRYLSCWIRSDQN